jgi:cytochrome b subunit of formate dehydrogenase
MLPSIRRPARWRLLLVFGCALGWALAAPGFAQENAQEASQELVCSDCHDVDPAAFEKTVHGAAGIACTDCHTGAAVSHEDKGVPPVDCASCHQDAVDQLKTSPHGQPAFIKISGKPTCQTCHGPVHQLVSHEKSGSKINGRHLTETCAQCHASPMIAKVTGVHLIQPIEAYKQSVHAKALAAGKDAPTCAACHGSHGILPAADPNSKVNRRNVPDTCGACHADIEKAFQASVHGQAAAHGTREAPVCTDCHGEHRILSVKDPGSPVFASNLPTMTCGRCHSDLRVTEKFNLPSNVVPSFEDSFHGLSSRAGSKTVANCASCHGVHLILPSSDPRSMINKANLATTCGKCHPGAGTRFAIGAVHVVRTEEKQAAVFWIRRIYLWLIWLVIGGMVVHNLLDLRRKVLSPLQRPMVPLAQRPMRMSRGFRLAHGLMMVSFMVLAYSGFALTYPEAWWAAPLVRWEEQVALRGLIHRIAAVAMLVSLGVHIVHLVIDRRARACIRRMWPNLEDLHELRERLKWYFGRRPDMPTAGVLGYAEKAEYLALIWGLVVMAITGFLLWFENFTLHWFPKWVTDVSTTIHFYEAVLASLAILVWHFYFVLFDPLVYPMDTAWLNGREAPGRLLERKESTVEVPGEEASAEE